MTIASESEKNQIRYNLCVNDGLYCARYFFKQRFDMKMIISLHHRAIQDALDAVRRCEISRLIINVPPGYTKTELAVINFIVQGLLENPMARFLHLSYSAALALENSATARTAVKSAKFQEMKEVKTRDDSDSKAKWWTEQSGGVYATSTGGQVTGFRAGHMNHSPEHFTGALIIDDPTKPGDAGGEEMENSNKRFGDTVKSRLAVEEVPIIVIMQRVHKNDLSGFLLKGGNGQKWHHLNLPVIIDSSEEYPEAYTHGIPIDHCLPDGWLWEKKHNDSNKDSILTPKSVYWSQYRQKPEKANVEGALWTEELIQQTRVRSLDIATLDRIVVSIDPSGDEGKIKKEGKKPDKIGIVAVGKRKEDDGFDHFYIFSDKSRFGSPSEWANESVNLYWKCSAHKVIGEKNYGGGMVESIVKNAKEGKNVAYKGITATGSKIARAEPVANLFEQFRCHIVGHLPELEDQMCTYNGSGLSPNNYDAAVHAVRELAGYYQRKLRVG